MNKNAWRIGGIDFRVYFSVLKLNYPYYQTIAFINELTQRSLRRTLSYLGFPIVTIILV